MALKAGRVGVRKDQVDVYGKIKESSSSLPIATSEVLGGVKVGNGLSVTEEGVLSASGGGSSVSYADFDVTNITVTAGAIENKGTFQPTADMVGKRIVGAVAIPTSAPYLLCVGVARASDPMAASDWLYPMFISTKAYTDVSAKVRVFYM